MSGFEDLLASDAHDVFLNGEFSQKAIFTSDNGESLKEITVQFFGEALDKMDTTYYHAWCAVGDIPNVEDNDTLEIAGIVYGIMDVSPDEFNTGLNLFLQKVDYE